MTLNGRTALITGASSGLGEATAVILAAAGCRLLLVGQNRPRLSEVGRRTGGQVIPADLRTEVGLNRVATAAQNVNLLINNAGIGWAGSLEAMTPEEISHLVASDRLLVVGARAPRGRHVHGLDTCSSERRPHRSLPVQKTTLCYPASSRAETTASTAQRRFVAYSRQRSLYVGVSP